EHRANVVKLLHAGALVEAVFDISANHRRGVFGAQNEARTVAVFKGVHFLRGWGYGFPGNCTRGKPRGRWSQPGSRRQYPAAVSPGFLLRLESLQEGN